MYLYQVAVLITCHNRKEKTIQSLESLFKSIEELNFIKIFVYLVDDGSTDGTYEAVKDLFPSVNVILGTGNLFWNQGMRLAWMTAVEKNDYDFYLWLNDDTYLDQEGLFILFQSYMIAKNFEKSDVLVTGACRSVFSENEFSYGGKNDNGPVIPNGEPQICKYLNGNVVLVSRLIFNSIGYLSNEYIHGFGDYDYGFRAQLNGFRCYSTYKYVAECNVNSGLPKWCNPEISIKLRWNLFHSPLGLNIKDYIIFRRRFWKTSWFWFVIKAYFKMFFPRLYFRTFK